MFIRRQILLAVQAAVLVTAQLDSIPLASYPATIEIDLVFPRNETYANIHPIPVVFAIQNAASAWLFGFNFQWNMSAANLAGVGPFGNAQFNPLPNGTAEFPPTDPFFVVNNTKPASSNDVDVSPGLWTLGWSFSSPQAVLDGCVPGAVLAQGTVQFTIAAAGAGGAAVNLTGCPQSVGLVTVHNYQKNCGVVLSSTDLGSAKPCSGSLPAAQASSILSALGISGAQSQPTAGLLVWVAVGVSMLGAMVL